MNKFAYIYVLLLFCACPFMASAQSYYPGMSEMPDTLDEEDLVALRDTTLLTRKNVATDTNALDYLLEHRYIPSGESFTKSWYDHLYVGGMGGAEFVSATDNAYKYGAMSQIGLLVGKEFSQLHGVRLTLGGSIGYQTTKALKLSRYMVRADYFYNVSSYFSGYNPTRMMNTSLMFGIGYQNVLQKPKEKMKNPLADVQEEVDILRPRQHGFEARFGAQLKFFTGPQGYFTLEPYIGVGTDKIDYQLNKNNWKRYDLFYGITMNYNFYLGNNLSPQSKARLLAQRVEGDMVVADSTLASWQTPWFFEMSTGPVKVSTPQRNHAFMSGMVAGWGHEVSIAAGKWLSPVIGVRLGVSSQMSKWKSSEYEYHDKEFGAVSYGPVGYNTHYVSGRFDALFNPMGLMKRFSWDMPWGGYLLLGAEMGWLTKYNSGIGEETRKLSKSSEAYSIGAHLWARLSEDLQFFVEPRYKFNNYRIPYIGINREEMFRDNTMALNLGVTVHMRARKFGFLKTYDDVHNFVDKKYKGFMIGAFVGMPLLQIPEFDLGSQSVAVNYGGYGEFHFNQLHSVHARVDLMSFDRASLSDFTYQKGKNVVIDTDDNDQQPEVARFTRDADTDGDAEIGEGGEDGGSDVGSEETPKPDAPTAKGLWSNKYKMMMTSLDYQVNLTNLLSGRLKQRMCELNLNVGPSVLLLMKNEHSLHPDDRHWKNCSDIALTGAPDKSLYFGANVGLKLSAHIWKGIYFVASPQLYFYKDMNLPGMGTLSAKGFNMMQTINVGVQYKIGSLRLRYELRKKLEDREKRAIQKRNDRWDAKQIKNADKAKEKHQKLMDKRAAERDKVRAQRQKRIEAQKKKNN